MPRGKGKKGKQGPDTKDEEKATPNNQQQGNSENGEDSDGEPPVPLPSQEHCTWLLNIIKIHATKIAKELLDTELIGIKQSFSNQIQVLNEKLSVKEQENSTLLQEVKNLKGNLTRVERQLIKKYTNPANRQELLHAKVNGPS